MLYVLIARWLRTDLSPVSGMAVVILDIPTGYIISRDTIEWMYSAGFPGLKRVRFYEQQLIAFFEYVRSVFFYISKIEKGLVDTVHSVYFALESPINS